MSAPNPYSAGLLHLSRSAVVLLVLLSACGGGGFAPTTSPDSSTTDASEENIIVVGGDGSLGDSSPTPDSGPGDGNVGADTGTVGDGSTTDAPVETGPSCEAGTVSCNGACVNEQSDPNNCGTCSKVCPGPDAGMGSAQCTAGMCSVACNGSTTLDCNGTCSIRTT